MIWVAPDARVPPRPSEGGGQGLSLSPGTAACVAVEAPWG